MGERFELSWGKARAGELLENWPRSEDGGPEEPVLLCHCECLDMSDQLRMNMLKAYGIHCLSVDHGDGNFGRLILGMSGEGVDIFVPKSLLEDALALCEEENNEEL